EDAVQQADFGGVEVGAQGGFVVDHGKVCGKGAERCDGVIVMQPAAPVTTRAVGAEAFGE
ncbi:MAG TPA: hypothetical protein PLI44_06730, partial [Chiayiivirga sp.]|nr:hypothetical protein [Chiayiivirga sp.]